MLPNDKFGVNLQTLHSLEVQSQQWSTRGTVLVLGDFNARVGELPNVVFDPEGEGVELKYIQRTSVDKKVSSFGRRVMASLNAIGLVLVNGMLERAELTSFQTNGQAVVDQSGLLLRLSPK